MIFDDDWTGVFIRGDNALFYGMALKASLERLKEADVLKPLEENILGGLSRLLLSARHQGAQEVAQKMKTFDECIDEDADAGE